MSNQNPTSASTPNSKPSFKDRVIAKTTPARKHAKTVLAGVGVVSIGLVALNKVAKSKGVDSVKVDLPNVDVTTDAS